jgi:hypothetical protein
LQDDRGVNPKRSSPTKLLETRRNTTSKEACDISQGQDACIPFPNMLAALQDLPAATFGRSKEPRMYNDIQSALTLSRDRAVKTVDRWSNHTRRKLVNDPMITLPRFLRDCSSEAIGDRHASGIGTRVYPGGCIPHVRANLLFL